MPSNKRCAKHSAGKALVSGKKSKQASIKNARCVVRPCSPSTSHSLTLTKIDNNGATTVTGRALSAVVQAEATPAVVIKATFKVVVLGPVNIDYEASFGSPAVLDFLDLVRRRHAVKIENDVPLPNSLTIIGATRDAIHSAHKDINGFMHNLRSPMRHQLHMILPLGGRRKKLTLVRNASHPELARCCFEDEADDMKCESIDKMCLAEQISGFRVQFTQFADVLRSVPSNLHMVVQFGRLLSITQDVQCPISSEDVAKQIDAARGKSITDEDAIFEHRIGGAEVFGAMQQQVLRSGDAFYPCSSVLESLLDVEPQRFLVGIMETFRFEIEIGPPGSAPDKRSASLSNLRVFQTIGSEGKAGLTIACPNRDIDWKLETIQELLPGEIPSTIKAFLESVTVVDHKEQDGFPMPVFRPGLSKENRVKQLIGKTAWTVGYKGTRYMLELCLYHKISTSHMGEAPNDQGQVGMSILNSGWEETLKSPATEGGPRDLGANWDRIFRPRNGRGTPESGIESFLKLVDRVLVLWHRANGDATRSVASQPITESAEYAVRTSQPDPLPKSSSVDLVTGHNISGNRISSHLFAVSNNQEEEVDLLIFD
ncbi:uncharacterized protein SPSK_03161 [Sporothrix schenckii 1099-18]|uniref:Uncharacterized protein n=1 Tax=Sporothrix schenckii 1099-18 TaxID=1397361 RepID=A0A0F2LYR6_SPOSC|nr:uncharacterized protein SPSK_03161 [Sporothrix schenckii 1099-18]KJR82612.1 hypothetical protein SPSK_03161 [Sporothrix schenckii 1099-18]